MSDRRIEELGESAGAGPERGAARPEFPDGADAPPDLTRRSLLGLLGASAAFASGVGCSRGAAENIVPYVRQPPEVTPSRPSFYATAMPLGGTAIGMLVESHEGRPTKAEGNPAHPASLGALGTFAQASVLELYDPMRPRAVTKGGAPSTWRAFVEELLAPAPAGKAVHVLLEPTSAPHVVSLVVRARERGDVVVHYHAPLSRGAAWEGSRLAFRRIVEPRWDFSRAEVVLALDADFLAAAPSPPSWARAWAERRRPERLGAALSRLYCVEPRLTVTGMSADARLRVQARAVRNVAAAVLAHVLATSPARGHAARDVAHGENGPLDAALGVHAGWARAVARDLVAHAGASLVVAGDAQPPSVHALAHALNDVLGNVGAAVTYGPSPVHEAGGRSHGLQALIAAMDEGSVASLVVVGGDPAYTAPADLAFRERLRRIPRSGFVGQTLNETARSCDFFVPEAHFLEAWGDARAFDGTLSIIQPLVRPLGDVKTAGQVLAALVSEPEASARDLVRAQFASGSGIADLEAALRRTLARGVADSGAFPAEAPELDWPAIARELAAPPVPQVPLEIVLFADAKVYDGRFGDSACLQELPDPVTKLTWDNAAQLSPRTAARLGLKSEDLVVLVSGERRLRTPVLVVPGTADDVVALALGYGRAGPHPVGGGVGVNAYALMTSAAEFMAPGSIEKTGATWPLAVTQEHWDMEGRPIVLVHTASEYATDPEFAKKRNEDPKSLYFLRPAGAYQWAMTIDLNACTGCSACVVACVAENNIPVVGKGGVRLSREMHWLRIDRYFVGGEDDPRAAFQPMLCQHCEKAPCEYVCPVNATVHSPDGLNEMVYNRCVGTRFCSNNCPYKVRRFNFFNYNVGKSASERLAMNPDVTVRARGVMEKCTYCVQRIREAEIRSRNEQRKIKDGEVVTACQQTCPTGAIAFGDLADVTTDVARGRKDPRLYQVLPELGTLPRTRYLARIRNPNPEVGS